MEYPFIVIIPHPLRLDVIVPIGQIDLFKNDSYLNGIPAGFGLFYA